MYMNYQPLTLNDEMTDDNIIQMKHNEIIAESEKEILEEILNHKIIMPFFVVNLILFLVKIFLSTCLILNLNSSSLIYIYLL